MFGRRTRQLIHDEIVANQQEREKFWAERDEYWEVVREIVRENRVILRRHGEKVDEGTRALRELTQDIRAQRQALLHVLDRMNRTDPGDAAA